MEPIDRFLFWMIAKRGYEFPSAMPPEEQRALRETQEWKRELQGRIAHLDAMASASGLVVPKRRDKTHA